jgi:hypothetical protein
MGTVRVISGDGPFRRASYSTTSSIDSRNPSDPPRAPHDGLDAEGSYSVAEGHSSHAAGVYAHAAHEASFVWSDGGPDGTNVVASTAPKQFTVHAENGIRLLGGPVIIEPCGDLSMGEYNQ